LDRYDDEDANVMDDDGSMAAHESHSPNGKARDARAPLLVPDHHDHVPHAVSAATAGAFWPRAAERPDSTPSLAGSKQIRVGKNHPDVSSVTPARRSP
jgi:hypothetical protein